MASNSENIRRIMNLMESATGPTLVEGWVDNLKSKIQRNLGDRERADLANRLKKEWNKWLGQTGREGSMDDMIRFMKMRIGFKEDDIDHIISRFEASSNQTNDEDSVGDGDEDETKFDKKIERGNAASASSKQGSGQSYADDDEIPGKPIPDDLNTKLYDYAGIGLKSEPDDAKVEPGEIVDDRKNYLTRGQLDMDKISKKLKTMEPGQKLTLGKKSYYFGPTETKEAFELREADVEDVLDSDDVTHIMDLSASHINDEYILNGPEHDRAAEISSDGSTSSANQGRKASPNTGGKKPSGEYDADEMWNILKIDFEKNQPWLGSITRKVSQSKTISEMSENDYDDLALIGWAFLRART